MSGFRFFSRTGSAKLLTLTAALFAVSFLLRRSLFNRVAAPAVRAHVLRAAWLADLAAACCGFAAAASGDRGLAVSSLLATGILLATTPPKIVACVDGV
jgi:hypothetical protein